jgi:predicted PurR-regulated permease PerM
MPGNEKKYFALLILAVLTLFLLYASVPLLAGISGAAILYVLLKPLYLRLLKKTNRKTFSAAVAILLSLVVIMVPLFYLLYLAIAELNYILGDIQQIENAISPAVSSLGYDSSAITDMVRDHIQDIAAFVRDLSISLFQDIVSISINTIVMYLILYYALTEHKRASDIMKKIIPFSKKNAAVLMREFNHAINTTFIGNGAASLVLGFLLSAGLVLLGADHFFLWLLIGTIMAFIPIIGIQIIWIPVGVYYLVSGDYIAGGGIIIWGAFLSYIFDGYIRQLVQKRVGEMHPLVSLIGLIIGITYFGITGLIIGPLILTLVVLVARMFREEYVPAW